MTPKNPQLKTKDIFISLENDFAFKHVMKNEKALKGFLGAVMGMAPEDITDIQYMDTQLGKESESEKAGILDVRVFILGGKIIDIELQMNPFKYWRNRSMFYNFKSYTEQSRSGSYYEEFKESAHIGIRGFSLFKNSPKFYSKVQLLDTETFEVYSDKVTFYVIELNKLKYVPKEKRNSELYYWSCLINAKSKEEYEMLAKQNDYLKAAVDEAEKINLDEKLKYAYLMRQLEIMDEATQRKSYYEEGIKEGKLERMKEIVMNMHNNKIPPKEIAQLAGVSLEMVNEIIQP